MKKPCYKTTHIVYKYYIGPASIFTLLESATQKKTIHTYLLYFEIPGYTIFF